MSLSEFRYNRKRKHFSYIYGVKGDYRKNIVISTKKTHIEHKRHRKVVVNNVPLYSNPDGSNTKAYLLPKPVLDHKSSFGDKSLDYSFNNYDKRNVKKIKRSKNFKRKKQ